MDDWTYGGRRTRPETNTREIKEKLHVADHESLNCSVSEGKKKTLLVKGEKNTLPASERM